MASLLSLPRFCSRSWVIIARVTLLGLLALPSCGGATGRAGDQGRSFAPYAGADMRLLDDSIEASAVGLADVGNRPGTDPALRARTQAAELVGRVKVSTVSADSTGGQRVYRLTFVFVERLVSGSFSDAQVEVVVRPDSPAFGIVKWLDTGLIGRPFVAFFKRYAGADEPQVHFHLAPDSADVVSAVGVAKALHELRGT